MAASKNGTLMLRVNAAKHSFTGVAKEMQTDLSPNLNAKESVKMRREILRQKMPLIQSLMAVSN